MNRIVLERTQIHRAKSANRASRPKSRQPSGRRKSAPRVNRKAGAKHRPLKKVIPIEQPIADLKGAYEAGTVAGAEALRMERLGTALPSKEHFRTALVEWFGSCKEDPSPPYHRVLALGSAFRNGYAASKGENPRQYGVPIPLSGNASVVIIACNEERTIGTLLDELERLPIREMIVVLNGCTDNSFAKVKDRKHVILAYYPERLGHDVGRSVGAALASGDSLLFVDGDMAVPAEELAAFLYEQEKGTDVVLNDISGYLPLYNRQDEVTRCKLFLNQMLGRPDLKSNSMTAVPHVISRRALDAIGTGILAVPPKAQAAALLEGLTVSAPCTADVIGRNRVREGNSGAGNSVLLLILGDHLEALSEAMLRRGTRLFWPSTSRPQLAKARNRP